jgi:hypothetical protein
VTTDEATSSDTPPSHYRRAITVVTAQWPALCLIMVAFLGYAGGLEFAAARGPLGHIQNEATSYLDRSQAKAVEAFAVGRSINAAVSVLKSVEISPVIANVAPLEMLEPVDDLAKQFSDVMALSIAAILVQRLLLAVAQTWALGVVLPVGCLLWLFAIWSTRWPGISFRASALGRSIVILALFARLVVPVAGWAGDGLTERFLARDLNEAVRSMNVASGRLEQFTPQAAVTGNQAAPAKEQAATASQPTSPPTQDSTQPQSYRDWMSGMAKGAMQGAANIAQGAVSTAQSVVTKGQAMASGLAAWIPDSTTIPAIANTLKDVPDQIVTAIEIFLVQTVIAPLVVAAMLYSALRTATRPVK